MTRHPLHVIGVGGHVIPVKIAFEIECRSIGILSQRVGDRDSFIVQAFKHRRRRSINASFIYPCVRGSATPTNFSKALVHSYGTAKNGNTCLYPECTSNGFHVDSRTSCLCIEPSTGEPAQPSFSRHRSPQACTRIGSFLIWFQPCGDPRSSHRQSRVRAYPCTRHTTRLPRAPGEGPSIGKDTDCRYMSHHACPWDAGQWPTAVCPTPGFFRENDQSQHDSPGIGHNSCLRNGTSAGYWSPSVSI